MFYLICIVYIHLIFRGVHFREKYRPDRKFVSYERARELFGSEGKPEPSPKGRGRRTRSSAGVVKSEAAEDDSGTGTESRDSLTYENSETMFINSTLMGLHEQGLLHIKPDSPLDDGNNTPNDAHDFAGVAENADADENSPGSDSGLHSHPRRRGPVSAASKAASEAEFVLQEDSNSEQLAEIGDMDFTGSPEQIQEDMYKAMQERGLFSSSPVATPRSGRGRKSSGRKQQVLSGGVHGE